MARKDKSDKRCLDCGVIIDSRAKRCADCAAAARKGSKIKGYKAQPLKMTTPPPVPSDPARAWRQANGATVVAAMEAVAAARAKLVARNADANDALRRRLETSRDPALAFAEWKADMREAASQYEADIRDATPLPADAAIAALPV